MKEGRRVLVWSKPKPDYTEAARSLRVEGRVVLSVVLTSFGEVTDIVVVEGLPFGLTQEAIKAARRIKFEPAAGEDGSLLSRRVGVVYEFTLG